MEFRSRTKRKTRYKYFSYTACLSTEAHNRRTREVSEKRLCSWTKIVQERNEKRCVPLPDELASLGRGGFLNGTLRLGVFTDEERRSSLLPETAVVQCQLGTCVLPPEHVARDMYLVVLCSKLRRHACLKLKSACFECAEVFGNVQHFVEAQLTPISFSS